MNHDRPDRTSPTRCLIVLVAAVAAIVLLLRGLAQTLPRLAGPVPTPDDVVVAALVVIGVAAAGRLALGAALLALDAGLNSRGRTRPRLTAMAQAAAPAVLRRAVTVGVAAGLGLASVTGAVAAEPDLGWVVTAPGAPAGRAGADPTSDSSVPPALSPPTLPPAAELAVVSVPAVAAEPHRPTPAPPDSAPDLVVVGPGDTLWGLTADRLGPQATAAEIAAAWPAVHAANRETLGADPDVIHPGQAVDLAILGDPA